MERNPKHNIIKSVAKRYWEDKGFHPKDLPSEGVDLRIYRPYFSADLQGRFESLFPGCSEVYIACLTWQSRVEERIRRIIRYYSGRGACLCFFVAKTRFGVFHRPIIGALKALAPRHCPIRLIKVDTRRRRVIGETSLSVTCLQEPQSPDSRRGIKVRGQTLFNNGKLEGRAIMDNWLDTAYDPRHTGEEAK
jgi:hypothetical protein